MREAIMNVCGR